MNVSVNRNPITLDRLRELLAYEPITGEFTWKVALGKRVKTGDRAGSNRGGGYRRIKIDGIAYFSHRLAWLFANGVWPACQIDHRDGDRSNNAITNLRDVSQFINAQNRRQARAGSISGKLGVRVRGVRFEVQIRIGGRSTYIGGFGTIDEAYAAYVAAKRINHPGCTL